MPQFFQTPDVSSAQALRLGQLYGSSRSLFVAEQIARNSGLTVIVCRDMADAEQLEREIRFFAGDAEQTYRFPDLETLPYDQFSPHQDIVSERIRCLATISSASSGFLILPVSTLLQKVAPSRFIRQRSLNLRVGERCDPGELRERLTSQGYRAVAQVEEHGEFSARGSILDLFPMGSMVPFRIDFFDDEVETIRSFDPETQLSIDKIESVDLLPAQERLYIDAIHHTELGVRLKAWVMFTQLTKTLERDLEAGRLPRADPRTDETHPNIGPVKIITQEQLNGG